MSKVNAYVATKKIRIPFRSITSLNLYIHNCMVYTVMKTKLLTVTRREVDTQFVSSLALAAIALSNAFRCTTVAVGSASCRTFTHR